MMGFIVRTYEQDIKELQTRTKAYLSLLKIVAKDNRRLRAELKKKRVIL